MLSLAIRGKTPRVNCLLSCGLQSLNLAFQVWWRLHKDPSHHPHKESLNGPLLNLSLSEALLSMGLFIAFPWPTTVNMNCAHSNQRDEFQKIKSIHHSEALGSSSSPSIIDVLNQASILGHFIQCFSADLLLQRHSSSWWVFSVPVAYAGAWLHFPMLFLHFFVKEHPFPKLGVCF